MSASKVNKLIKDNGVKYVDLRFTDTIGKEQHVTVPTREVDSNFFKDGKMFDGSSISGWKGINESDMILMPDTSTAVMDLFADESTMNLRCDIVEPTSMKGYERDPRSLAHRAEAYLKSTGIADTAYFGPENEFFIFDDVRWGSDISGSFYKVDSDEGCWNTGRVFDEGNMGHRPGVKGGYFPYLPLIHCMTCVLPCVLHSMKWAHLLKYITTKWRPPANVKLALPSIHWCAKRMKCKF